MPRHLIAIAFLIGLTSSPAIAEDAVPIVHLMFRDHLVTILAFDEGPRYTVRTKGGGSVASDLRDDELLARFPDLHDRMKSGIAGDDGGTLIWAGNEILKSDVRTPRFLFSEDE